MQAFFVSTIAVAVGEIGDKTQLLAFLLAARYRRPWPIIAGIFVATLLNHALAGLLGHWLMTQVSAELLRWSLGLSFLLIAVWTLKPDEIDDAQVPESRWGIFSLTLLSFFLAEIGDKTQLATVALAVKYADLTWVVAGTTVGMLIADVPAVLLGKMLTPSFPFHLVRRCAAAIFAVLGVIVLLN
ncbi:MAG: TMEM165/GDT1 family protein [Burkholderiales bacterium]|nr:TMEM165/GDT1 family protein [Burkholderiales bacterium]